MNELRRWQRRATCTEMFGSGHFTVSLGGRGGRERGFEVGGAKGAAEWRRALVDSVRDAAA